MPFVFFTFFSVNGSAAEHSLLSVEERKRLAEKFLAAGKGKLDLIVIQCGTENLVNTKELVCYVVPIMNCIIKILHFRLLMLKVLVLIVWQPLHQLISRLKIQVGTVYLINGGIIQYAILVDTLTVYLNIIQYCIVQFTVCYIALQRDGVHVP